jgi:hypothetical protein
MEVRPSLYRLQPHHEANRNAGSVPILAGGDIGLWSAQCHYKYISFQSKLEQWNKAADIPFEPIPIGQS